MTNTPLRIGLIGAGRIGKVHGEAISTRVDSAELAAVSDTILPAARHWQQNGTWRKCSRTIIKSCRILKSTRWQFALPPTPTLGSSSRGQAENTFLRKTNRP